MKNKQTGAIIGVSEGMEGDTKHRPAMRKERSHPIGSEVRFSNIFLESIIEFSARCENLRCS